MSSAVRFKGLLIRRMPGFPSGGPALDFSGRDVNVIYGPNASGKTTAARALQALLWPRAPGQERWSVTGCFQIGDAAWTVDLEAGFRQVQCDGRDAAHPVLSPLEYRDRYRLGLQELMAAEDQDLAEIIRRESAGGYDLGTAAADLGFADRIPRRGPESQSLDQARQQVRMAQQNQRTLRGRQDELAGLKVKEKQAIEARRRIEDLKLALERVRAAGRVEAAEKALGLYPPAMEKLAGNEIELLEAVQVRLTRESEIRAAELDRLDEARRRLEDAALPAEGVPDDLVPTLRRRIEELDRAAVETDRLTQDLVRSRARAEQERSRLDGSADPERLARIDIEALGDLAALARRAERVRGDRAASRALEAWLGPEEASPDLETLREGWRLLSRWLSDPDEKSAPSGRRWLVFLAGAVASAGAVLAWRVDFDLLLLSALGLLLLWPAVRPPAGPSSRQRRAADFEGLGLRPPDSWTPESVLARTDEFRKAIGAAGVSMERAQRWSDLGPRREKLERDLAELDRDREDIVSRLGLGFDLDEAGLFLLAEGLRRWQEARARVSGAEAALGQAQNRGLRIQADLEKELAVYRYPEGGDRVSIGGRVEDLGRRVEMRRLAVERIREAERKRVELDDRLRSLAEERDRIFSSAGLEPGAESELRRLLELRPSCIEAAENLRTARYDRDRAESALDGRPELTRMSESDIRSEIERCRRLDEALAGVSQTIGQITEAVDQAGRGHDLEEALALEDDCRARLETARERDLSSAAGWLLSRHLERENQDRHLPEVFHRARDLFARLTQGRYELDLDLGRACFRARDTVAGLGCDLEALSGATRLHLLLAVRMAFVESREQGPRLPLLLDETLANSDPERAEAVIDAAAEFCRQGRQVIYFTARPAEVAMWERRMSRFQDLTLAVLDLDARRRADQARASPLPVTPGLPKPGPPPPDGMDHGQYGRLLDVPGLDLSLETIGGVHLWYLVDDPDLLYRLLALGLEHWGPLENLMALGGRGLLDGDRAALDRAAALARVLEGTVADLRVGRGRPVDRQALIDGGVTDTFIDRVRELAAELDGRAEMLIDALEQGRVKRFTQNAREKLRRFFEENGYLDPRPAMSPEDVRLRALARAAPEVRSGAISPQDVPALLARIGLE